MVKIYSLFALFVSKWIQYFYISRLVVLIFIFLQFVDYALEEEQADIDIIEKARGSHDDNDDSYFVKDPKKALRHFFETAGLIKTSI